MKYEVRTTSTFAKWLNKIKNKATRYRLEARLSRLIDGNFGDAKTVATDLFELRFFFDGGLRIYYTVRDTKIIVLLCGGNKSTQGADIEQAKKLLDDL